MVGFASAGSRFSTTVKEENLWAFRSLTLILSASRALLALQYTAAVILLRLRVKSAARGITYTACGFWSTSIFYTLVRLLPHLLTHLTADNKIFDGDRCTLAFLVQ